MTKNSFLNILETFWYILLKCFKHKKKWNSQKILLASDSFLVYTNTVQVRKFQNWCINVRSTSQAVLVQAALGSRNLIAVQ